MKRTVCILSVCLAVCCFFGGCSKKKAEEPETPSGEPESTRSVVEEWGAALARVEELLEAQALLNAKTEQRLDELEERDTENAPPEQETATAPAYAPESDFRYTENGGEITILDYIGHDTVVRIPETIRDLPVVAIGEKAFQSMNVESVVLPEGVALLDWFSFAGCYRLTSVTLPASVTEIGYGAFERCPASLTFLCPPDSYAASYAASYGFSVQATET